MRLQQYAYLDLRPLACHKSLERISWAICRGWIRFKCYTASRFQGPRTTGFPAAPFHPTPQAMTTPRVSTDPWRECRGLFSVPYGHYVWDVMGLWGP